MNLSQLAGQRSIRDMAKHVELIHRQVSASLESQIGFELLPVHSGQQKSGEVSRNFVLFQSCSALSKFPSYLIISTNARTCAS